MAQMRQGRFGMEARIMCKTATSKSGAEFGKGYLQLGNKLYKVTVCGANKDGAHSWVNVAECRGSGRSNSSHGYSYSQGGR